MMAEKLSNFIINIRCPRSSTTTFFCLFLCLLFLRVLPSLLCWYSNDVSCFQEALSVFFHSFSASALLPAHSTVSSLQVTDEFLCQLYFWAPLMNLPFWSFPTSEFPFDSFYIFSLFIDTLYYDNTLPSYLLLNSLDMISLDSLNRFLLDALNSVSVNSSILAPQR